MIVRELIVKLGFQLNQSQINKAEQATSRLKERANEAADAFRNIAVGIASIASVRALATLADSMQNIEARIGMLPQTVGDVGAAFEEVGRNARATRTPLEAYATLYNRLGNAGKDYIKTQEDLLKVTNTISNALIVGGASAQEAGSVMLQFSQAIGSGTLQGEEFRAMAEAAPQFLDQLAVAMGYPREQLKKMGSEGKLTSREVIEAVKKMHDYFERRAKQMPMNIGQAMTDVNTRFSLMIARMNRESGTVTEIANFIIGAFDKVEAGIDSIIDKFDGLTNAIRYVGIAIGLLVASKAFMMIAAIGAVAAIKFSLIAAAVLVISAIVEDIYVWLKGGESVIGRTIELIKAWGVAILQSVEEGFAKAEIAVLNTLKGWSDALYNVFFETIPRAVKDAWEYVKNLPMELWAGIKTGASNIASAGGQGFASVTPSTVASRGIAPQVTNQTNVSVTVPAGTPQEQVSFIERAAKQSFADLNRPLRAIDMGVHAQ